MNADGIRSVVKSFAVGTSVSRDDLGLIAACCGRPVATPAALSELMASMASTKLSIDDTVSCVDELINPRSARRSVAEERDMAKAIHACFDLDGSGNVDLYELGQMLQVLGRTDIDEAQRRELMAKHGSVSAASGGKLVLDVAAFSQLLKEVNLVEAASAQITSKRTWLRVHIVGEDGPLGVNFGVDPVIGMAIVLSTKREGLIHRALRGADDPNLVRPGDRLEVLAEGSDDELVFHPFEDLDVDGDGVLDKDEVAHAMRELFGRSVAEAELKEALRKIDADGDGTVSFAEFKSFMATAELERIGEIVRTTRRPFTMVFSRLIEPE
mgnify:CR=1 FL=1